MRAPLRGKEREDTRLRSLRLNRIKSKESRLRPARADLWSSALIEKLSSLEDRVRFLFRFFSRSVRRYGYKLASHDWGFLKALLQCSNRNWFFDYVKGRLVALTKSFVRRLNGVYYWLRAVNPCNFRGWLERSVWLEPLTKRRPMGVEYDHSPHRPPTPDWMKPKKARLLKQRTVRIIRQSTPGWRHLLRIVNGSLGKAVWVSSWRAP